MNLHQLRLLREVADRGTIAAAADSLSFTPSAVSQQLAALEKTTGVAVLERIGRNVRLTDAGRELVSHAQELLAGMEAAQAAIERVNGEVRGTLTVSVYESFACAFLPAILTDLGDRYPDLAVLSRQIDPDAALELVQRGDLDISVLHDNPPGQQPLDPGIDRFPLFEDRFHLVVSTARAGQFEGAVQLAELSEERFIGSTGTNSCGRFLLDACNKVGFAPNIVHETTEYPSELHLAAADQGIALVPDLGLRDVPDEVRVLDLEPPLFRVIGLAYRSTSAQRPAIKAFCDAAERVTATMRD